MHMLAYQNQPLCCITALMMKCRMDMQHCSLSSLRSRPAPCPTIIPHCQALSHHQLGTTCRQGGGRVIKHGGIQLAVKKCSRCWRYYSITCMIACSPRPVETLAPSKNEMSLSRLNRPLHTAEKPSGDRREMLPCRSLSCVHGQQAAQAASRCGLLSWHILLETFKRGRGVHNYGV
jgi:hypothetical protein